MVGVQMNLCALTFNRRLRFASNLINCNGVYGNREQREEPITT